MAQRVGPSGRVTGIDTDATLGQQAMTMLRACGHRQCGFAPLDLTADEPIPGAPFDLVYARLLISHLPDPARGCGDCGTPSRPADTCSSRTTTCTPSPSCPRPTASRAQPRHPRSVLRRQLRRAHRHAATEPVRTSTHWHPRRHRRVRTARATRPSPTHDEQPLPKRPPDRDRARHHHPPGCASHARRGSTPRRTLPRPPHPVTAAHRRLETQARRRQHRTSTRDPGTGLT